MTASREPAQVWAILALARPVADEIVLGVDSRVADPVLAACADLVDRPLVYEFDASIERHVAWLHHACRGDWILRLDDDDEVPGAGLLGMLGMLGELATDRRRMLILLPRRHLFPTSDRFLSCHPWSPDYEPRLVRNAPGAWWFAGRNHTAIEVLGERRRLPEAPLYHLRYAGLAGRADPDDGAPRAAAAGPADGVPPGQRALRARAVGRRRNRRGPAAGSRRRAGRPSRAGARPPRPPRRP